jgi:aryl-alcohol dehydrogenase-like predicted oxidoreductase
VVAKSFDLDIDQPVGRRGPVRCRVAGKSMSQVPLAWPLAKPLVSAPIVGASKPHHLADAAAAVAITSEVIRQLEEPYTPQAPYWW